MQLSIDQQEALDVVLSGHNIMITGQAGTGKSFLVKQIYKRLRATGRNVKIVCSSGIASTIYSDVNPSCSTVHAFFGLKTADLPFNQVVQRALSNNLVRERVKEVDCLIWDEVYMSSRRTFELVHKILVDGNADGSNYPFSRVQVVLVGEFLQLRPVPNIFDEGHFLFKSPLFKRSITHRFELTTIQRQDENDLQFLSCLREIRIGHCSVESENFLKSLSREIQEQYDPTHIFFKKIPTQVFNLKVIRSMPGREVTFEALDSGEINGIQCPADETLTLKEGCKVMLVWNKSNQLKNGSAGLFIKEERNYIIVNFNGVGNVKLCREVWQKKDSNGNVIGTRSQFPVILMYAITCHKAQGLTLPAAVVHCSKEFVPGLLYVSLTRVRNPTNLQVLNFKANQLSFPHQDCLDVCTGHQDINDMHFNCCRQAVLLQEELDECDESNNPVFSDDEDWPCSVNVFLFVWTSFFWIKRWETMQTGNKRNGQQTAKKNEAGFFFPPIDGFSLILCFRDIYVFLDSDWSGKTMREQILTVEGRRGEGLGRTICHSRTRLVSILSIIPSLLTVSLPHLIWSRLLYRFYDSDFRLIKVIFTVKKRGMTVILGC